MPLVVECENGHRLACPETASGTTVICPKCGAHAEVSARNASKATHSALGLPNTDGVMVKPALVPNPSTEEQISFACPNGHRLKGPADLRGTAGECPKCKIRFRIMPVLPANPPAPAPPAPSASPTVAADEQSTDDSQEEIEISLDDIEEIDAPVIGPPPELVAKEVSIQPQEVTGDTTLAELFASLWREREHGGVVELDLGDGVKIQPDWWAEAEQVPTHGLFAVEMPDGSYEMQAVAWSHVRCVLVRGLKELPGGVFE